MEFKMDPGTKRHFKGVFINFAVFLSLSLLYAAQFIANNLKLGRSPEIVDNLITSLLQWLPWCFLVYIVLRITKRYPIERKKWAFSIPLHLAVWVFLSMLHSIMFTIAFILIYSVEASNFLNYFFTMWIKTLHFNFLVYAVIVSVGQMWDYYKKNQENKLKASELEGRLAKAQLEVMRTQLNPHFLFNTLHAILALVRKEPETAEAMLVRLSGLLRKTLETSKLQEVPLSEELDFLKIYLDIQKIRFRDRFSVNFDVGPETLGVLIPNLLLQPIVENAIRHGIAPHAEGGKLKVSSRLEEKSIVIEVRDSGPGFPAGAENLFEKGFGLKNTRDRLQFLYGQNDLLILENAKDGGARVVIRIPLSQKVT
jgi:two-component system LytT family sensor kinase